MSISSYLKNKYRYRPRASGEIGCVECKHAVVFMAVLNLFLIGVWIRSGARCFAIHPSVVCIRVIGQRWARNEDMY